MILRLQPWKDGYINTRFYLQNNAFNTKTVHLIFSEAEFVEYLQDNDAVSLFEAIGSTLPRLDSVIIELEVSSELPALSIPPLLALTSLLTAENKVQLQYLTMKGLLMEGSDLEIYALAEAIRIHPSLHSIVIKNCTFARKQHLQQLRNTVTSREGMKHSDLFDNVVVGRRRAISWWKHSLSMLFIAILSILVIAIAKPELLSNVPLLTKKIQYISPGRPQIQKEESRKKRTKFWKRIIKQKQAQR